METKVTEINWSGMQINVTYIYTEFFFFFTSPSASINLS